MVWACFCVVLCVCVFFCVFFKFIIYIYIFFVFSFLFFGGVGWGEIDNICILICLAFEPVLSWLSCSHAINNPLSSSLQSRLEAGLIRSDG